eukprot:m.460272 g.460272  ORF g.460272 m.460272 type:complete len:51 (+) comp227353_c0_seq1:38-190(+)
MYIEFSLILMAVTSICIKLQRCHRAVDSQLGRTEKCACDVTFDVEASVLM